MSWIEGNYEAYLEHHMIALIVGAVSSSGDQNFPILPLVERVKALYN